MKVRVVGLLNGCCCIFRVVGVNRSARRGFVACLLLLKSGIGG